MESDDKTNNVVYLQRDTRKILSNLPDINNRELKDIVNDLIKVFAPLIEEKLREDNVKLLAKVWTAMQKLPISEQSLVPAHIQSHTTDKTMGFKILPAEASAAIASTITQITQTIPKVKRYRGVMNHVISEFAINLSPGYRGAVAEIAKIRYIVVPERSMLVRDYIEHYDCVTNFIQEHIANNTKLVFIRQSDVESRIRSWEFRPLTFDIGDWEGMINVNINFSYLKDERGQNYAIMKTCCEHNPEQKELYRVNKRFICELDNIFEFAKYSDTCSVVDVVDLYSRLNDYRTKRDEWLKTTKWSVYDMLDLSKSLNNGNTLCSIIDDLVGYYFGAAGRQGRFCNKGKITILDAITKDVTNLSNRDDKAKSNGPLGRFSIIKNDIAKSFNASAVTNPSALRYGEPLGVLHELLSDEVVHFSLLCGSYLCLIPKEHRIAEIHHVYDFLQEGGAAIIEMINPSKIELCLSANSEDDRVFSRSKNAECSILKSSAAQPFAHLKGPGYKDERYLFRKHGQKNEKENGNDFSIYKVLPSELYDQLRQDDSFRENISVYSDKDQKKDLSQSGSAFEEVECYSYYYVIRRPFR
jgi:hypothetical protein